MIQVRKTHYDFLKEVKTSDLRELAEGLDTKVIAFFELHFEKEIRTTAIGAFKTPLKSTDPKFQALDWDTFNFLRGEVNGIAKVRYFFSSIKDELAKRKKDVQDARDGAKQ